MSASVTSLPNPSLSSISSLLLKSSKTEKYFVAESSNVIETSTSFSFGANGWPSSTPSDDGESDSPNQAIAVMFTTSGFSFSTTVLITVAGSSRSLVASRRHAAFLALHSVVAGSDHPPPTISVLPLPGIHVGRLLPDPPP